MMKKTSLFVLLLSIVFGLAGSLVIGAPSVFAADQVKWYGYEEGMALAQKENKRIYLHFYTDWCQYCNAMEKSTFHNAKVAKILNEEFIAIRVDTTKQHKLASRYNIRPVPDNWFLSPDGKKLRNFLGYYEADQFVTVLRYVSDTLVSQK
jgi:thioredoxin-related protein